MNKIKDYIKAVMECNEQLNKYATNRHIAQIFEEVLEISEYVDKFPELSQEKHMLTFKSEVAKRFTKTHPSPEEIHEAYQGMREKKDPLRNMLKLVIIINADLIMPLRVKRDSEKVINKIVKLRKARKSNDPN